MSETGLARTIVYQTPDPEKPLAMLKKLALEMYKEGACVVAFGDIVFQWPEPRDEEDDL